jgi:hypothetical protein
LRRFAQGLRDDDAALKAGVTVSWSNGPVEGHINRLKMLKRHMFGRAHLDLLGHRFLRPPRERVAQDGGPREQEPTPAPAQAAQPTHPLRGYALLGLLVSRNRERTTWADIEQVGQRSLAVRTRSLDRVNVLWI